MIGTGFKILPEYLWISIFDDDDIMTGLFQYGMMRFVSEI
ncbi:hypothetical protein ZOSMA_95G00130 [Zostera marina]|uniref:Uncharacterized protein n=1 Tax=Zostera marina TaxID=29655 RepID=A0A0K9NI30_ZOSMR|nr:hypothetical protein ZOSMA_95G00130 [Zostera marina]